MGVWLGGGGIVPCVSNKTVISIIMYVDRVLDFLWLCCGYWTRRPSNLEAFCKGLEGIIKLACK